MVNQRLGMYHFCRVCTNEDLFGTAQGMVSKGMPEHDRGPGHLEGISNDVGSCKAGKGADKAVTLETMPFPVTPGSEGWQSRKALPVHRQA